jgi:hypothetical protein
MKQLLLFTLGCMMIHTSLYAQQLRGVIVNEQGERKQKMIPTKKYFHGDHFVY